MGDIADYMIEQMLDQEFMEEEVTVCLAGRQSGKSHAHDLLRQNNIAYHDWKVNRRKKMNCYHTTEDGQRMLIAEMSDNHLLNTLKMHLRKLNTAKKVITTNENMSTKFNAMVNGEPVRMSTQAAETYIEEFNHGFSLYLYEGFVRGLDLTHIKHNLNTIIGRDAAMVNIEEAGTLPYEKEEKTDA